MATTKSTATIVGRQELTKRIAVQAGLTQKKAAEVLEATLDNIRDSLKSGRQSSRSRSNIGATLVGAPL